ncbi:MAG: hypothetical protein Q4A40_05930 [Bacillota bacterium]|nr:hypothetical protein [Bacillota bacterium]
MACFLVTAAEAVVATAVKKGVEASEKKELPKYENDEFHVEHTEESSKVPFSRKLKWLSNLLWGGAALLCFEHIWHGEVVPWFPFLTAAANPADKAEMLHEMSTIGVSMAVICTAIWCGMLIVCRVMENRRAAELTEEHK